MGRIALSYLRCSMKDKIINGHVLGCGEAIGLCRSLSARELGEMADAVRTHFLGRRVDTCSIMNARSGRCSEDCKWCAQSAHYKTGCGVYDYSDPEEAVRHAENSKRLGIARFSLVTSGRSIPDACIEKMCGCFRALRKIGGIGLCGSFGLLTAPQFARLREAGMERFHCNLETAPS